ncbi:MAG: cell division protein FtsZ [archaeon]|nr:cell division protein FtsZ [archaeon]
MNTVENDIAVSGDARIAVIGVGGAGCRIASRLYGKMSRVGVIAINTDRKALEATAADTRLYICKEVTKGMGTHGDPALGKKCAQIHDLEITSAVKKYDYAFIVAGMGGGTGSGAASVVAELCDRANVKIGAITIMPFSFENRNIKAAEGYRALHAVCQDIIRVENDKALTVPDVKSLDEAMNVINDVVIKAVDTAVEDARNLIRWDISEHLEDDTVSGEIIESGIVPAAKAQKSH